MSSINITLKEAETLVARCPFLQWQGWEVLAFDKRIDGYTKKNGMWKDGVWGVVSKIRLQSNGTYDVPKQYESFLRSTKH